VPITFQFDDTRRRIHTTILGAVTLDDVRTYVQALVRANALGCADLIDARATSGPGLFSGDIRRIAQLVASLRGDHAVGPRAIVVTSNAAYGMVRMLAVLASPWAAVEVFREVEPAERWLRGLTGAEA
jgi:hypothetical protein